MNICFLLASSLEVFRGHVGNPSVAPFASDGSSLPQRQMRTEDWHLAGLRLLCPGLGLSVL